MDASIAAIVSAKRINVVGVTGSGKTTLARQIAGLKKIPHFEMDRLFWLPDWQELPDDEFNEKLAQVVAQDAWVLDGNYKRTTKLKWPRVECVVWIDLSFPATFRQLFSRCVDRIRTADELWPGTGNRETFKKMFFSRTSILWWLVKMYRPGRKHYVGAMDDMAYSHITFVRLKSRDSVVRLLELLHRQLEPGDCQPRVG